MTTTATKRQISGFCNPTLPRTPAYDPHQRCKGCDCAAANCPCNPEAELCACGADAALVGAEGMWCADCIPPDVAFEVEAEHSYDAWMDTE